MCGRSRAGVGILVVALLLIVGGLAGPLSSARADTPAGLSVVGNQLEANGSPIQLRGVGRGAYENCASTSTAPAPAVYDAAQPDDTDDDFADGPVNQASIDVMKSWGINSVRLPVNESCWLGLTDPAAGQPTAPDECVSGSSTCETMAAQYQQEVENYINLLGQNGLYVVIDLQTTAPQGYYSDTIDHFPDAANTPTFWTQVSNTFKTDPWVMFDLVGEIGASQYAGPCYTGAASCPDDNYSENWTESQIWNCWLNGCSDVPSNYTTPGGGIVDYDAVGMQSLIDTVRSTGASNPVIVGSPDFSRADDDMQCSAAGDFAVGDQSCWSVYTPHDPDGQMVVDNHLYDFDFLTLSGTTTTATPTQDQESDAVADMKTYIDDFMVPIGQSYPLMIGEMGETDCDDPSAPFVPALLADLSDISTADGQATSVFGWSWDADDDDIGEPAGNSNSITSGYYCPTGIYGTGGPPLITDYDGSTTAMGQVVKTWIQQQAGSGNGAGSGSGAGNGSSGSTDTTTSPTTPTPTTPTPTPTPTDTSVGPAPPTSAAGPQVSTAPHITASGTQLVCSGAEFTNAAGATASYSWYSASTGKRVAGPSPDNTLAASKVRDTAVECRETITTPSTGANVTTTTKMLPVPGAVSAAALGPAKLTVICPVTDNRRNCAVAMTLQTSGAKPVKLGSATLTVKRGRRVTAQVRLSAAGRRLLQREKRLTARLTVSEVVSGVRQVIATSTLKLRW